MKSIVVTGSEGFLGKHTVVLLKKNGFAIRVFDKTEHSLFDPSSMRSLLTGVDGIVHLAGVNRATSKELLRINTLGTNGLLEAVEMYAPGVDVVFASSLQVYDKKSSYGLSKLFAEKLIEQYTRRKSITGMVLRFSNIYGPGARPNYNSVIATFMSNIKSGKEIIIHGTGNATRDFLFVEDAAQAIYRTLVSDRKKPFDMFDICTGESVSIRRVLSLLLSMSEQQVKVRFEKTETIQQWTARKKSFQKAKETLGWEPTVSLKNGLHRIIQYCD